MCHFVSLSRTQQHTIFRTLAQVIGYIRRIKDNALKYLGYFKRLTDAIAITKQYKLSNFIDS